MFLDTVPPDTSGYMIAGYGIFFLITFIYLVSLLIRTRNLNQDLSTLKTIEEERQVTAAAAASARRKPAAAKAGRSKQTNKKAAKKR